MRSAVFICILLVVMVTSDDTTTAQPQQQTSTMQQNVTDLSNSTDVSDSDDDDDDDDDDEPGNIIHDVDGSTDEQTINQVETTVCSINSQQYDTLNNKLTELAVQLELLETAIYKINLNPQPETISGRSTIFR